MRSWAQRLDWVPLLALVEEEKVYFYDLRTLEVTGDSLRIDEATPQVEHLLDL